MQELDVSALTASPQIVPVPSAVMDPRAGADVGADDALARLALNTGKVLLHHLAAVGVPTVVREVIRHTLERGLTVATAEIVATASLAAPVVLEFAGLVRDARNGTGNRVTVLSRVVKVLLVGSVATALAATGSLPTAAPSLVAMSAYGAMRDTVQHFLRLRDNNVRLSPMATGIAAGAYGANQFVVDQAATACVELLEPLIDVQWANACVRALMNIGGELAANLTQSGLTNLFTQDGENRPLRVELAPSCDGDAVGQALNTGAGRLGLLNGAVGAGVLAEQRWGPLAGSGMAAGTLAAAYGAFIFSHGQSPSAGSSPTGAVPGTRHRIEDIV
ncbi:hypothetical protein [Burkholderia ambifaria]|uniref:hypothetical protein n=1 Tax=Burkholderia ambifaria TaxID=152480 RepID=UPI0015903644|nr:hypothetical protein [Burkholderia ambifaria]